MTNLSFFNAENNHRVDEAVSGRGKAEPAISMLCLNEPD
jgi:hypothetical protein